MPTSRLPRLLALVPVAARALSISTPPAATASYDHLKKLLRDVNALSEVEGILSYDEQCFMPPGAAASRATQKAALAKVVHEMRTGEAMAAAVEAVRGREAELPDAKMRANVRDAVESFDKQARKSAELAEAEARLESEAFAAWQGARKDKDFSAFAPKLKEMFALKQQVAKITRPAVAEPYDGALDAFERGMTAERLDEIFAELRAGVVPLLAAIQEKRKASPEIDAPPEALKAGPAWDEAAQAELSREIAIALGWQADNGRLDVSTHPFTGGAGPEDVRITTRYSNNWIEGLGATVHETGHALYEQGRDLGEEGRGLPASVALSMGVHESQSLLWERMVGQSRAYWSWVTPKVHERFPFTKECTAEDFYKAFNRVTPGCIRVESDEVTYPLHVILRYDIERALFRGEMSVDELPEYWNTRMKADLGVDVPDDAQGCLQDIHWSFGAVGYFPSYTLGAVIAVQLFEAAQASIGADTLDAQLAAGEFAPLREWLRENIHAVGSVHPSPDELLTTVCGEGISAKPFLKYLTDKYTELYDL